MISLGLSVLALMLTMSGVAGNYIYLYPGVVANSWQSSSFKYNERSFQSGCYYTDARKVLKEYQAKGQAWIMGYLVCTGYGQDQSPAQHYDWFVIQLDKAYYVHSVEMSTVGDTYYGSYFTEVLGYDGEVDFGSEHCHNNNYKSISKKYTWRICGTTPEWQNSDWRQVICDAKLKTLLFRKHVDVKGLLNFGDLRITEWRLKFSACFIGANNTECKKDNETVLIRKGEKLNLQCTANFPTKFLKICSPRKTCSSGTAVTIEAAHEIHNGVWLCFGFFAPTGNPPVKIRVIVKEPKQESRDQNSQHQDHGNQQGYQ